MYVIAHKTDKVMTCAEALEKVFDYIDNSTIPELTSEIEAHITQCLNCHERFEFEQLLKARINRAAKLHAPEQLKQQIERLIAARS